jgi:hypothetical protein
MKERNKKIFLISTFLRSVSEIRIFFCLLLNWNWSVCFSNEDAKRVFFFESITATWVFVGKIAVGSWKFSTFLKKWGPHWVKIQMERVAWIALVSALVNKEIKKGNFLFSSR